MVGFLGTGREKERGEGRKGARSRPRITPSEPCPWDKRTCARAVYGGHREVLQWARTQAPP